MNEWESVEGKDEVEMRMSREAMGYWGNLAEQRKTSTSERDDENDVRKCGMREKRNEIHGETGGMADDERNRASETANERCG